MKTSISILMLLVFAAMDACNTTRGLGEDVEAAGEGIQNAAEEVEEELEGGPDR